ncbi:hypothetical protein PDIDSM_6862 [Penicillium digitatum]|nr:hypothetical protein PDIDSM_6862 [Penicillium digitatum]
MSFVDSARFRPTTPPHLSLGEYIGSGHSCHASNSSVYSSESSPWSTMTGNTSPTTSPTRHHHGPKLLPKIRLQDVVIFEPVSANGPLRHRRVLSNTRNPPPGLTSYPPARPSIGRRSRNIADRLTLASPISPVPMTAQGSFSALSSPVTIIPSCKRKAGGGHSRSVSASVLDVATLTRFGYPTYRELPKYTPQMQAQTTPTTPVTPITPSIMPYLSYSQRLGDQHFPASMQTSLTVPTPQYSYRQASAAQHSPVLLSPHEDLAPRTTTLLSYLTLPIQPINIVRNVSVVPTRGLHDYFWWDIRNLRNWSSFSLAAFDSLDSRLIQLLKTEIPAELTPRVVVSPASLAPESEHDLVCLIRDLYAPRINAALAVSQGKDHLQLYAAPDVRNTGHKNHGHPHFLANYLSDTEQTSTGLPRGRLVGIVKSFDRWNTGMRNEAPHRRVEYLNGLAHLQRCMREHSCRYGFIITEIELVCVRAGCDAGDEVPYFGYLEIAASIPLKTATGRRAHPRDAPLATPVSARSFSSSSSSCSSFPLSQDSSDPEPAEDALPAMTAGLGLYFLLMLSKSVPLPHQPSAHLNVGGPGAMTRQRILVEAKDKWIPEPQIGEKRDAKRGEGWDEDEKVA